MLIIVLKIKKIKTILSNLPQYIHNQCKVNLEIKSNLNLSLGEGEHTLCILSRLFIFAANLEEKIFEHKLKVNKFMSK